MKGLSVKWTENHNKYDTACHLMTQKCPECGVLLDYTVSGFDTPKNCGLKFLYKCKECGEEYSYISSVEKKQ